jgi:hypothetical protein
LKVCLGDWEYTGARCAKLWPTLFRPQADGWLIFVVVLETANLLSPVCQEEGFDCNDGENASLIDGQTSSSNKTAFVLSPRWVSIA